jgi:hypothetical protein
LRVLGDPELLEGIHQEYAVRLWNTFYSDRMNLAETGRRRLRLLTRTARDFFLVVARPRRWRKQLRARTLFHYHLFASTGHAEEIATALGVLSGEIVDRRTVETRTLAETWMPGPGRAEST